MATAKQNGAKPKDELQLSINGRAYSMNLDDLTIDEIEVIEDAFDKPADELTSSDWKRTKMMRCLVYFLMRRDGQDVSLEDVGEISLSGIEDGTDSDPPTKRRSAAKQSA